MRVVFVHLGLYGHYGGQGQYAARVARVLSERAGAEVEQSTVISLWDWPDSVAEAPAGARFVPCAASKVKLVRALMRSLLREKPELVVFGHVLLVPLGVLVRVVRPRARILLFVYGIEVWSIPGKVRKMLVHSLVDSVIAISDHTAALMQKSYSLLPAVFEKLPCAVDAGPRDLARQRNGRTRVGRTLLSVARLDSHDSGKNIDKVILALPLVRQRVPDVEYIVIGHGVLKQDLERLARTAGVHDCVQFLGRVSDAKRDTLYAGCDVFVLPSEKEGFGIVFLEAWCFGLPVIGGRRDAAREVVRDGVDGLLVDPSPEEIAAAVTYLLEDSDRRVRMGHAGQQRVVREYSHGAFSRRFIEILEAVVNDPKT